MPLRSFASFSTLASAPARAGALLSFLSAFALGAAVAAQPAHTDQTAQTAQTAHARDAIDALDAGEALDLVILHVNDTHAFAAGVTPRGVACDSDEACFGGYARIARAVGDAKAAADNVIALDAGDRWQGTLLFSTSGPNLIASTSPFMPWDAVTLGNHEFDLGCRALADFIAQEPFPVLAANLRPGKSCALSDLKLPGYVVKTIRGVKVGILGLANDEVVTISKACPETRFDDEAEAARRAVEALKREGVEIVVAITHEGYPEDRALARAVDGIDVIVGGHTHSLLGDLEGAEGPYPTVEHSPSGDPVLVVQAKRSTEYLGRLEVRFEAGRAVAWSGAPVRLSPEMPRDARVEAEVQRAAEKLRELRETPVARNANRYADGIDSCRRGECLSGMLTADAILTFGRTYDVEIALVNGGAIRSSLPVGKVDRGSIQEIHPFGNTIAVVEIDGRGILAALEHGLSDEDVEGPRLMQPAGLRYRVDPEKPVGSRLLAAEVRDAQGAWQPIDPAKHYRVALLQYIADGGDDFAMFAAARHIPVNDALDADVVTHYLELLGDIPMPETGRIVGYGPDKP